MSSTVDCTCNNCGSWHSANPDGQMSRHIWMPKGWVALITDNGRLHLCSKCWGVAKATIAVLPRCESKMPREELGSYAYINVPSKVKSDETKNTPSKEAP